MPHLFTTYYSGLLEIFFQIPVLNKRSMELHPGVWCPDHWLNWVFWTHFLSVSAIAAIPLCTLILSLFTKKKYLSWWLLYLTRGDGWGPWAEGNNKIKTSVLPFPSAFYSWLVKEDPHLSCKLLKIHLPSSSHNTGHWTPHSRMQIPLGKRPPSCQAVLN